MQDNEHIKVSKLRSDTYYYKYIFKKTEKVVYTVFYYLTHSDLNTVPDTVIKDVRAVAQDVHDSVLESLSAPTHATYEVAELLLDVLAVLESKLRIMVAVGAMSAEHFHVFYAEIDSLVRTIQQYKNQTTETPLFPDTTTAKPAASTPAQAIPRATTAPATTSNASQKRGRRERIREILGSKGQASIKDISDVITDVSEKTIQRELNAMIKDNIVVREGERRWSVYQLA